MREFSLPCTARIRRALYVQGGRHVKARNPSNSYKKEREPGNEATNVRGEGKLRGEHQERLGGDEHVCLLSLKARTRIIAGRNTK